MNIFAISYLRDLEFAKQPDSTRINPDYIQSIIRCSNSIFSAWRQGYTRKRIDGPICQGCDDGWVCGRHSDPGSLGVATTARAILLLSRLFHLDQTRLNFPTGCSSVTGKSKEKANDTYKQLPTVTSKVQNGAIIAKHVRRKTKKDHKKKIASQLTNPTSL